jgi:subtilisin family serine protease
MGEGARGGRIARFAAALLLALVVVGPATARPGHEDSPGRQRPAVPSELLVGFRAGVSAAEQNALLRRLDVVSKRRFGRIRGTLAMAPPGALQATLEALQADPRVRYAEPNYPLHAVDHGASPSDPFFHQLWGLDNFGQAVSGVTGTADADVDAPEAWAFGTGSSDVVVGVIDTGIALSHPDLASNLWTNEDEVPGNGLDDDGNGYVDDWRGWDFANDDNDPSDDNGHGTHVAGTIGARGDDGVGVAGLSWQVRLMPLKFLGANGSGTTADAVEAILYAAANGADLTNNSWSGAPYSQALLDAIAAADTADSLFVAAAGNDGLNTDSSPAYPSSYASSNVVSVAATDAKDARPFFSNYGRRSVDLGAPGANIYSTWLGGTYRLASGTSMAAPHVAGTAALLKARFPGASDLGLKALLLGTVDANTALATRTATGGRLNAGRATSCAAEPHLWVEAPAPGFEAAVGDTVSVTALAAACADPAGATLSASLNGSPLALGARSDGLYSGSFTVTEGGPLTLELTASAGDLTLSRTVAGGAALVYPIEADGAPVTVSAAAGQNLELTFSGPAGQRVSMSMTGVTIGTSSCCGSLVSITRPDGGYLAMPSFVGTKGGFVDTRTLPQAGTYTILVDPQGDASGSITLALHDVPPDPGGTLAFGAPTSVETTDPGQNARLSFAGLAGGRISLAVGDVTVGTSTCCSLKVSVLRSNGLYLVAPTFVGTKGGFLDTKVLPSTGTYTVLVDPQGSDAGGATLTLYDVPPDATGSLPLTVSLATPGQNARLTFTGTAGQSVTLRLTNVTLGTSTCCDGQLYVFRPDGTRLSGPFFFGTNGKTVPLQLPTTGAYTVQLDPQDAATGSVTASLG